MEANTTTGTALFRLLACCAISSAAYAGILVSRSAQGLQFTDAVSITFNAKDKALSLGDQPKLSGPVSKLPSTHLNGTLLKDSDAGVLARYESGAAEYLLPQGLPKTAPDSPAAIWTATRITYKKSAQDKVGADIPAADFVAFLPAGAEELTRLCMDDAALQVIGGKGKSFTTQMELMSAVVKAYASDPAMAPLGKFVEDAMRRRYDRFESGAGGVEVLTQALKFAELSGAVYPSQAEQAKLRQAIAGRKQWLDRKAAILRAFAAGSEWDAFLLGDRANRADQLVLDRNALVDKRDHDLVEARRERRPQINLFSRPRSLVERANIVRLDAVGSLGERRIFAEVFDLVHVDNDLAAERSHDTIHGSEA